MERLIYNAELAFFGFLFSLLSFLLFWSFGRFLFYALLGVLRFGHGRVFKVQVPSFSGRMQ